VAKVIEVGPFERMLTVTIDPESFAAARKKAAATLSRDRKIKGFREGKAPLKIVESMVGAEALDREAVDEALPKALATAIADTDLRPVVYPRLMDVRYADGGAQADVVITLWPTVSKLPKYKGRKVTVELPVVTDADVDGQIDSMREQFAELDEVQREGFDGDHVLVDISTSSRDQQVAAGSTSDLLYEIGSGLLFDGMDDALRGVGAGGIVSFDTVLPEAMGPDGGKQAAVRLLVKKVHARRLPELTDEWVDDVTEFETVAAMRARLADDIQKIYDRNAWQRLSERAVADLTEDLKVELPDALATAEMESVFHRFAHRLETQGVTVEQYLQLTGQTSEAFSADLRSQAEANLRTRILLETIAEQEGIDVTPEELDREITALAAASEVEVGEYRKALTEGGHESALTGDILRSKAVDRLLELVVPVGADGKAIEMPERTTAADTEPADPVGDDAGPTPEEVEE
jgi:trigger factor